jgi:hypothetical protein
MNIATAHHLNAHHSESFSARKHPEFVVLDIGEEVGALIVHTEDAMHGVEVEISPASNDRDRSHKEVLERTIDGQPAYTAVFDGLRAGTYTLWTRSEARERGLEVQGGTITEVFWRDGARAEALR